MSEPIYRQFLLVTGGQEPSLDGLAIIMEVLGSMSPKVRAATIVYLSDYYGYRALRTAAADKDFP